MDWLYQRLLSRILRRIFIEIQPDITVGTIAADPAPRCNIPVVFDIVDDHLAQWDDFGFPPWYRGTLQRRERAYADRADGFLFPSRILWERFLNRWSLGPERLGFFIPNCIDIARYRSADGRQVRERWAGSRRIVGYIGALNNWEEIARILRCAEVLRDTQAVFLIVGDGRFKTRAEGFARRIGLTNVKFVGGVDYDAVPDFYAALDVGICPYNVSPARVFSMKLVEYLAAGKIVVTTALSGLREFQFSDVIISEPDPESFAQAIRNALDASPSKRNDLRAFDAQDVGFRLHESLRIVAEGSPLAKRAGQSL